MILLCFFLSGACGLLYEVVWIRMLVLVIGSTTFAVSAAVISFMAGLALGSYVFGRAVDRFRGGLLFYAILEVAIGVYAVFVPHLLDRTVVIYQAAYERFGVSFYAASLLRFAVAFTILLVPTCLMGGTLPVLSRYCARRREQIGGRVGLLYALNTLGATLGAFLTGFFMLPRLGVSHTVAVAAAVNVGLGVLAFLLWLGDRRAGRAPAPVASPQRLDDTRAVVELPPKNVTLVLIAFAVSGFCGMVYQVAWSRVLTLIIGSSVYGVTTILVTFLLGLGVGSLLCSGAVARGQCRSFHLGVLLVFIGLSSLGTVFLFQDLPYWFLDCFGRIGGRHDLLLLTNFALSLAVMLVPALLLGMTFPVVVGIYANEVRAVGTRVGEAYCVNIIGAIMGSFAAGFVLVPFLGVQSTVLIAIAADFLFGLALVVRSSDCRFLTKGVLTIGVITCAVAGLRSLPPWNRLLMSSGVYHYARALNQIPDEALRAFYSGEGDEVLSYAEGMTAAVCVAERRTGARYMRINGKVDASTGDLTTQILLAHIPLLLKPGGQQVMVVGYGTGMTVGSALCYPLESLECAESEAEVVRASLHFNHVNNGPLKDERLALKLCDARNYLLVTDRQYDVIISHPSNPWITGVSNLFTRDFLELAASRLVPEGVFCQWFQIYSLSTESLRVLMATFQSVFPHVFVFASEEGDVIVTGSRQPLTLDGARLAVQLSDPSVKADLARIGVGSAADLLGRFLLGTPEMMPFIEGARINTDDNALIEFATPKTIHEPTIEHNLAELRRLGLGAVLSHLERPPDDKAQRAARLLSMARVAQHQGWTAQALVLAQESGTIFETAAVRRFLGSLYAEAGQRDDALAEWHKALALDPENIEIMADAVQAYLDSSQLDQAEAMLRKLLTRHTSSMRGRYLRGLLRWKQGQTDEAMTDFRLAQLQPNASVVVPRVYYMIGLGLKRQGKPKEAVSYLARYLGLAKDDVDARFDLGATYYALGRRADAVEQWQLGVDATRAESRTMLARGRDALARKQEKVAEERLRAAIDMDRMNLDAYIAFGALLERQSRTRAGIVLFEQVVRRYPKHSPAHFRLGVLHEMAGKKTKAASHFREYLMWETNAERRAQVKQRLKALESSR